MQAVLPQPQAPKKAYASYYFLKPKHYVLQLILEHIHFKFIYNLQDMSNKETMA
jgi:hypothetical protein